MTFEINVCFDKIEEIVFFGRALSNTAPRVLFNTNNFNIFNTNNFNIFNTKKTFFKTKIF